MKTEIWHTIFGDGWMWRVKHPLWYAESEQAYSRHWSAVRGLQRFLQRVANK